MVSVYVKVSATDKSPMSQILNPFAEVFDRTLKCESKDNCNLEQQKKRAIQVPILDFAAANNLDLKRTTADNAGNDIVSNLGSAGEMAGTCMIHCHIEEGAAAAATTPKALLNCRVYTMDEPEGNCTRTVVSIVDSRTASRIPTTRTKNSSLFTQENGFRHIHNFLGRFAACNNVSPTQNLAQHDDAGIGKLAINARLGTLSEGQPYGYCYSDKDFVDAFSAATTAEARNAINNNERVLFRARQMSGLAFEDFVTPDPSKGGSMSVSQCKEIVEVHNQVCVDKIRLRESMQLAGNSQSPFHISGYRDCEASFPFDWNTYTEASFNAWMANMNTCATDNETVLRDACSSITNWAAPEPTTIPTNDNRHGVPRDTICETTSRSRAGAARAGSVGIVPRADEKRPDEGMDDETRTPQRGTDVKSDADVAAHLNLCRTTCRTKKEAELRSKNITNVGPFAKPITLDCMEECSGIGALVTTTEQSIQAMAFEPPGSFFCQMQCKKKANCTPDYCRTRCGELLASGATMTAFHNSPMNPPAVFTPDKFVCQS
jgi:hypothetical protein